MAIVIYRYTRSNKIMNREKLFTIEVIYIFL